MIVVGITATMVIVLSQALPEISGSKSQKAKTEQKESEASTQFSSAPSDVVPGGIVQMDDVDRSLLETILNEELEVSVIQGYSNVLSDYLGILFSAIISPNAP